MTCNPESELNAIRFIKKVLDNSNMGISVDFLRHNNTEKKYNLYNRRTIMGRYLYKYKIQLFSADGILFVDKKTANVFNVFPPPCNAKKLDLHKLPFPEFEPIVFLIEKIKSNPNLPKQFNNTYTNLFDTEMNIQDFLNYAKLESPKRRSSKKKSSMSIQDFLNYAKFESPKRRSSKKKSSKNMTLEELLRFDI
jgi:hypothetical protein